MTMPYERTESDGKAFSWMKDIVGMGDGESEGAGSGIRPFTGGNPDAETVGEGAGHRGTGCGMWRFRGWSDFTGQDEG